ncbi:MAG: aminotransferase class I/II-fold pyridoxal phosphate-dependent enzyme [Polyangiaceae bacterium]
MSLVTASIESIAPYQAGKPLEELARELGITDAIKLASNENPLGPSPKVVQAVQQALTALHRYPDASTYRLREKLSEKLGVAMGELLPGNGSNELLELLVGTFATPEHHIVFGVPAFVVYRLSALSHGVPFTAVPLLNDVPSPRRDGRSRHATHGDFRSCAIPTTRRELTSRVQHSSAFWLAYPKR